MVTGCPLLDIEFVARQNGKLLPCARLVVENEKLRELVRDMAAEIRGLGIDFKRVGWCDYADRMRELGVEV